MSMIKWVHITIAAVLTIVSSSRAQVIQDSVPQLMRIDVAEHLGDYVPLDLILTPDHSDIVNPNFRKLQNQLILSGTVFLH